MSVNKSQPNIPKKSRFEQDDDDADDAPRPLKGLNKNHHCVDLIEDDHKSSDIDLKQEESTEPMLDLTLPTNASHHVDTNHVLGM